MSNIDLVQRNPVTINGSAIGHFTAVVTDRTTQVGCAISIYHTNTTRWNFTNYLAACNYASTNVYGNPVYKSGAVASGCVNGPDEQLPGLCKITEPIDPNIFTN
jgi:hypothetical protein